MLFNNTFAQTGAYANLNLGYNFNPSSQQVGKSEKEVATSTNAQQTITTTEEVLNGSLGKGLSFGVAFGYMFSDHFGAELGVSKLTGASYEIKYDEEFVDTDPINNMSINTESKIQGQMLQFNPSLLISTGNIEGLNAYGKFGLVLGIGSVNIDSESKITNVFLSDVPSTTEIKQNGGLAFGFSGAIGATCFFNKTISVFSELNMINLSYAPAKGEITKSNFGDTDQLTTATTFNKEIEYLNETRFSSGDTPDTSKPDQETKNSYSFGSFGLNIGLRYSF